VPIPSDFWEEFPLFMKADETLDGIPVKRQLGPSYDRYIKKQQPSYDCFDAFLKDAGIK
jgi:hypothetical protein